MWDQIKSLADIEKDWA